MPDKNKPLVEQNVYVRVAATKRKPAPFKQVFCKTALCCNVINEVDVNGEWDDHNVRDEDKVLYWLEPRTGYLLSREELISFAKDIELVIDNRDDWVRTNGAGWEKEQPTLEQYLESLLNK